MEIDNQELILEIKSIDKTGEFEAYGAVFNNVDQGGDKILPGAFKNTLSKKSLSEFKSYYNHNMEHPVAEFTEITEDAVGLHIKGKLWINHVDKAREAHFYMKKNIMKGFSIMYKPVKHYWEKGVRVLEEIYLHSIDPVFDPLNKKAVVLGVKSAQDMGKREFERKLRDVCGLSLKEAKNLLSGGWDSMRRDVAQDLEEKKEDPAVEEFDYMSGLQELLTKMEQSK